MAGFGGSVKLTGEDSYKKALANIRSSLKEVSSEMKLMSAQFQSSDKNTTQLATKSDNLSKKLSLQKSALNDLKSSYNQMAGEYDKQSAKTEKLEKDLDDEKRKLEEIKNTLGTSSSAYIEQAETVDKLEKELKESTTAQENMEKSLSQMRTQINQTETTIVSAENSLDKMNKELDETDDESKKAEKGLDDVGDSADKAGKKFEAFGKIAGAAAKAVGVALVAAAAGAVKIGTEAVKSYAQFEQLEGGVETLFGTGGKSIKEYADSVGKTVPQISKEYSALERAQTLVMNNAANAYKTAGMSANEYMDTVTSFSAALVSSMDGDTVAAARAADVAIKDMSDNANKMGTDISSIQNAYQGFAKQNYTMLDNLKLGYGGTKEEMKRLLEDAQKISGVKYDMSSLSDVYEAIHVIQNEMGITGTTAEKAEKTISGALGMVSASWQNLLTGMADDNADFSQLISNFVDSLVIAGNNLIPRIKTVISGLGELVDGLIKETLPKIMKEIPPLLMELLPILINTVQTVGTELVKILPSIGVVVINAAVSGIKQALPMLVNLAPQILEAGITLFEQLATSVESIIPNVLNAVFSLVSKLGSKLVSGVPRILKAGLQLLSAIVSAIPQVIKKLLPQLPTIILTITQVLTSSIGDIVTAAVAMLQGLIEAIPIIIQQLVPMIPTIVLSICTELVKCTPQLLQAAVTLFQALVVGLGKAVKELLLAIPKYVDNIIKGFEPIKAGFKKLLASVKEIFAGLPTWFKTIFAQAWQGIKQVFADWGTFFSGLWGRIKNTFSTLGTSIANAIGNAVKAGINGVISKIETTINNAISIINGAISLINKIPGVSVGKIKTLKFDRLAKGGIVDTPTIAEIGEAGREAVIPLENNKGWIRELAAELKDSLLTPISAVTQDNQALKYNEIVGAFKDALGQMQVVLDDEQLGTFVEKTVSNAIYT